MRRGDTAEKNPPWLPRRVAAEGGLDGGDTAAAPLEAPMEALRAGDEGMVFLRAS